MEKKAMIMSKNERYIQQDYKLEKDLEVDILNYSKEIFGENSHYFEIKKLIKSKAGLGTIPDSYAIIIDPKTKIKTLFIIEVELKKHSVKKHILPQIANFIIALKNPKTSELIINELIKNLKSKNINLTYFEMKKIVSNWKILIIIDEIDEKLLEIVSFLSQNNAEVITIPFQTYKKENSNDKLHYFETFTIQDLKNEGNKWNFKWETVNVDEHLKNVSYKTKKVFEKLRSQICNIAPEIKEVHRKKWTTYQISALKNFCTIKFFPNELEVYIKVDKDNFSDENNLCENIKRTPAWTFDKKIKINSLDNLDKIIALIKHSHNCVCKKIN